MEARGRTRAVGKCGGAAARERGDYTTLRNQADAVVEVVGHDDHAARGVDGDSGRGVEARGRARAVGEGSAAATCKRGDYTTLRNQADAVVGRIGHDDISIWQHSDSSWELKTRGRARAVGEAEVGARERGDYTTLRNQADAVVGLVGHDDISIWKDGDSDRAGKPRGGARAVGEGSGVAARERGDYTSRCN